MSKFEVLKGPTHPFFAHVNSLRDILEQTFKSAQSSRDLVVAIEALNGTKLYLNQLQDQSSHIAKALATLGATRIGICFTPSLELIVLLAGLVRYGGSYVPLDPSLPSERLKYFIEDSGVELIIYDSNLKLPVDTTGWTSYQELVNLKVNEIADYPLDVSKDGMFCLMYTSGSTGEPKGVIMPHRAMINRFAWQWFEYEFEANEVICFKTQIGFNDSLAEVWAPLLQNIPILVANRSLIMNPAALVSALEKYQVTRITVVPSFLRVLLSYIKQFKRSSADDDFELVLNLGLKYVITSGEELTYDLCELFFDVFDDGKVSLVNYYGSTEIACDATAVRFNCMDDVNKFSYQGHVSIGTMIANMTVIVHDLDDEGIGELIFTGTGVTSGYLMTANSHDQRMSDKFVKASDLGYKDMDDVLCFRTGDRGKVIDGKFLVYYGRADSQVKMLGYRVDLSEIEQTLKKQFDCVNPVVLFHNDRILVFLEKDEKSIDRLTRVNLLAYVPTYAIPEIVTVDLIPHLPVSGKVDRQALRAHYDTSKALQGSQPINWDEFSSLSGEELIKFKYLVDILLELNFKITCTLDEFLCSNFFSIGGSSLNAIMAIMLIQQKEYYIDVNAFLSAKDLKGIVNLMELSCEANKTDQSLAGQLKAYEKYTIVPSSQLLSTDIINLFATSFLCNSCDSAEMQEMKQMLDVYQPYSLKDDISFSILDSATGQLIGSVLNLDDDYQPDIVPEGRLLVNTFKLLTAAELVHVNKLRAEGITKILNGFVTAVDRQVITNHRDRVEAMLFLERETLRVAKEKGYQAVIATNTSKLTCDLAEHVLGYSVVETIASISALKSDLGHKVKSHCKGSSCPLGKICVKRIL